MRFLALTLLACLVTLVAPVSAQEFESKAKFAVLMDFESGTILLNKNADDGLDHGIHEHVGTHIVILVYLHGGKL